MLSDCRHRSGPVRNKDFIIHGTACRLTSGPESVFLCPSSLGPHGGGGGSSGGHRVCGCMAQKMWAWGNLWLSKRVTCSCPRRRCYFSPQGCLLWLPPWEQSGYRAKSSQNISVLAPSMIVRGAQDPMVGYLFNTKRLKIVSFQAILWKIIVTCINSMHMNL